MIDASRRLRHVKRKEKAKLFKVSYSDLSKTIRLFIAGRDPTTTLKKKSRSSKETSRLSETEEHFPEFSTTIPSCLSSIEQLDCSHYTVKRKKRIRLWQSQDTDEWYEYFDDFASLLNHPKSLVRNRFLYILATNAQWDDENRFDAFFDDYLRMSQMKNR